MVNNRSRRARATKETPRALEENLRRLRELFPEAFAGGKVDWNNLRAALGDAVPDDTREHFSLTWTGRGDALRLSQSPGRSTLEAVPEESVDFNATRHLFVEGDNLEVLRLLYKPYFGRVKMIYIDPPYNTGRDFLYPDDFSTPLETYLEITGQKDARGRRLTSNPETSGRFHSDWLSMMYPRLSLARPLLREDGAICVSIGEEELANLTLLMNEIFGEENYRNTIVVRRYDKNLNRQFMERGLTTLNVGVEYALVYARGPEFSLNPVYRAASEARQNFGYWKGFWNAADRRTMRYELLGVRPETGQWKWKEEVAREAACNYQEYEREYKDRMTLEEYWGRTGKTKKFIRRNPAGAGKNLGVENWIPPSTGILRSSNWTDLLASETLSRLGLSFDNPKNEAYIKELIRLCCDGEGIVLDFFAGSCTTAHAVLDLNREDGGRRTFIMAQSPEQTPENSQARRAGFETIAGIGRERIRRAIGLLRPERAGREDLGFKAFRATRRPPT